MADIRNRDLGEIYTPQCVSRMLKEQVEEIVPGFEKNSLIWDSCWGEGNLTRPLDADDLWCSTIREQDIIENASEKGNKFTYDFLNEDVDILKSFQMMWAAEYENLPEHIVNVLDKGLMSDESDDKPIIMYINPPYVSVGVFGANNTEFRDGATDCEVKKLMNDDKCGTVSSQAYAQFLYRILKMKQMYSNKRIYVALVSPVTYLCTGAYQAFRDIWFREFKFMSGKYFCADVFKGLSNRWGIATTVWAPVEIVGKNDDYSKHNFKMDLMKLNEKGDLVKYGEKVLYNIDGLDRANDMGREDELKSNLVVAPITCSCGSVVSNKKKVMWHKDSIGYMFYKGNNVYHNVTEIGVMSVPYGDGSGTSITRENALNILTLFTSKGAVGIYDRTWTNDKDEYLYPDKTHKDWKKLQMNAVLYSLFNDNTHFSSNNFPGVGMVENHFHYLSAEETEQIFGVNGLKDRFGYQLLKEAFDSGMILDSGLEMYKEACEMFNLVLKHRVKGGEFDRKYPQYQVWQPEAGYYQWKWILKEYYKDEYSAFRLKYKAFSNELKELIYEVGFLKNRATGLNGEWIE